MYRDVLARPKFYFPAEIINDVIEAIESAGLCVEADSLEIALPDPKDRVKLPKPNLAEFDGR